MKQVITLLAAIGAISAAQAQSTPTTTVSDTDMKYYTIQNVETHEVLDLSPPEELALPNLPPMEINSPDLFEAPLGISIGDIINIGQTVWTIIQQNKPVANVTTNSANALPKGVTNWTSLAGWQAPQVHTFQTTFTNGYGIDVVQFQYRLTFTPGGTYQGKGRYLTNVTVEPENVTVDWGYTFNATVTIPSITNAGTTQSPLAAAEVLVNWTVDTIIKHQQQSQDYYVRGDGTFQTLQ